MLLVLRALYGIVLNQWSGNYTICTCTQDLKDMCKSFYRQYQGPVSGKKMSIKSTSALKLRKDNGCQGDF